jgi:hypothetical protein
MVLRAALMTLETQVLLSRPDPVAMALLSSRTRLYTPGLGAPTDDMTGLSRACRLERRAEVAVRASPEAATDLSRCDAGSVHIVSSVRRPVSPHYRHVPPSP